MKSYQSLADSYDALMADAEHRRRAAFLMRAFRKSKPAVHTVLDLACGTGTIACLLAQAGYQVTATDASEEMLTQAAQKAAALSGQPPLFLCQSMPQLRHGLAQEQRRLPRQGRRFLCRLGQHLLRGIRGCYLIPRLGQQAGNGSGTAGQVQHGVHRGLALPEGPHQKRRPAPVLRVCHQGIIAVRQRLIALHCFLFFVRAKIRA